MNEPVEIVEEVLIEWRVSRRVLDNLHQALGARTTDESAKQHARRLLNAAARLISEREEMEAGAANLVQGITNRISWIEPGDDADSKIDEIVSYLSAKRERLMGMRYQKPVFLGVPIRGAA